MTARRTLSQLRRAPCSCSPLPRLFSTSTASHVPRDTDSWRSGRDSFSRQDRPVSFDRERPKERTAYPRYDRNDSSRIAQRSYADNEGAPRDPPRRSYSPSSSRDSSSRDSSYRPQSRDQPYRSAPSPSRTSIRPPFSSHRPQDPDAQDDPRLLRKSRLPPVNGPLPTLDSLSPTLLSALRLALMTTLGRAPSQEELEGRLKGFLANERKKEMIAVKKAEEKLRLGERKKAALDVAWAWARKAEEEAGLKGSEEDSKKDREVWERITERLDEGKWAPVRKTWVGGHGEKLEAIERLPLNPPPWLVHRQALKEKFPEGWRPPKRLSREAIVLLRLLQRSDPAQFTTPVLAERFKISPEAVRRILRTQFELPEGEAEKRETKRKAAREGLPWGGDRDSERGEMEGMRADADRARVEEEAWFRAPATKWKEEKERRVPDRKERREED